MLKSIKFNVDPGLLANICVTTPHARLLEMNNSSPPSLRMHHDITKRNPIDVEPLRHFSCQRRRTIVTFLLEHRKLAYRCLRFLELSLTQPSNHLSRSVAALRAAVARISATVQQQRHVRCVPITGRNRRGGVPPKPAILAAVDIGAAIDESFGEGEEAVPRGPPQHAAP